VPSSAKSHHWDNTGLPQVSALCRLDPPKERPVSMMEAGKSYAMSNKVACIFHFLVIGYIWRQIPTNKSISFWHLISPKVSCLEAQDLLHLLTISLPAHPQKCRIILVYRKNINKLTRIKNR